jgi:hypothetical protein
LGEAGVDFGDCASGMDIGAVAKGECGEGHGWGSLWGGGVGVCAR